MKALYVVWLVLYGAFKASGQCAHRIPSTNETFQCQNNHNISCYLFNNGANDCGDGSDEGIQFKCPRPNQFKCTTLNLTCCDMQYVHDGIHDCADKSDEQKLIGDKCLANDTKFGCTVFIANSLCTNNSCQCLLGAMRNTSGSACRYRVYGDICSTDTDCAASNVSLSCNTLAVNKTCVCRTGYNQKKPSNSYCTPNMIGDSCTVSDDCTAVMNYSDCTSNICVCDPLYKPSNDKKQCVTRVVGDSCTSDQQCVQGGGPMLFSRCSSAKCVCLSGYHAVNSLCVRTRLYDSCSSDSDCSQVNHGYCNTTVGECLCDNNYPTYISSYHVDYENYSCSIGLEDLYCTLDVHCAMFENSLCQGNVCVCQRGYYYSNNRQTCIAFKLGDYGCVTGDCNVTIVSGFCDSGPKCACPSSYAIQGDYACIYVGTASSGASTGSSESNNRNLAIALPVVFAIIAIAAILALVLAKRFNRRTSRTLNADETAPVVTMETGTDSDIPPETPDLPKQVMKPVWTIRPKSAAPNIYQQNLTHQTDPMVHAFFSGKKPAQPATLLETKARPPKKDGQPGVLAPAAKVAPELLNGVSAPTGSSVFVFKGKSPSHPTPPSSITAQQQHSVPLIQPSVTVRDENELEEDYHSCNYDFGDGHFCGFATNVFEEMSSHKKQYGHYIGNQPSQRTNQRRKRVITGALREINEEPVRNTWVGDELHQGSASPKRPANLDEVPSHTSSGDHQHVFITESGNGAHSEDYRPYHSLTTDANYVVAMDLTSTSLESILDDSRGDERDAGHSKGYSNRGFGHGSGTVSPPDISIIRSDAGDELGEEAIETVAKVNSRAELYLSDEEDSVSSDDDEADGKSVQSKKSTKGSKGGKSAKKKKAKGDVSKKSKKEKKERGKKKSEKKKK